MPRYKMSLARPAETTQRVAESSSESVDESLHAQVQ